ncbi:hypothetical protein Ciccas_005082 [Cichlidogyrus casuarinus]|uniref:Domain of unknown function DB domain-containing protein n=1 Tax=Cichlidogyrus casuarinus TaxID=1844966 RepID=A0ABD2Q9N4_9PLAT
MTVEVENRAIQMGLNFEADIDECQLAEARGVPLCRKRCFNMQRNEPIPKHYQELQCFSDNFDECAEENGIICQTLNDGQVTATGNCIDLPRGFQCSAVSVPWLRWCSNKQLGKPNE